MSAAELVTDAELRPVVREVLRTLGPLPEARVRREVRRVDRPRSPDAVRELGEATVVTLRALERAGAAAKSPDGWTLVSSCGLSRAWASVTDIAAASGLEWQQARDRLKRLQCAGWVELRYRGDGVELWRLRAAGLPSRPTARAAA